VTPEAEEHLDKAREALIKARGLLEVMHYSDEAARAAYLAGFHAAQALISERTGRIAKSHSGVRSTFARLVKDDPRVDRALVRFPGASVSLQGGCRLWHRPAGGRDRFRSGGRDRRGRAIRRLHREPSFMTTRE
jgi:uncharacterized protein (UPF0332 family)